VTVVCAWIRRVGIKEELVFAADSRLRLAGRWDACPKIFILPRSDALMAFAGETWWAYPIALQTANNIATFEPSRTRFLDLLDARGHAIRVINEMIDEGDVLAGPEPPEAEFLFGGFSSIERRFRIFRFVFDQERGRYGVQRVRDRYLGQYFFIGDRAADADHLLHQRMREQGLPQGPLDMQPFEVIRDMIREAGPDDTVGGAPQVAKVHRHLHSEIVAVDWSPDGQQPARKTVMGRPLLDYEIAHIPALDADDPSPAPPPGRGDILRAYDVLLMEGVHDLREGTVDDLREWVAMRGGVPESDVEEWVDYAIRRGLLEAAGPHRFCAIPPQN
jgi:hypothetical protein